MSTFLLFNIHFLIEKKEKWLSEEIRKKQQFSLNDLPYVAKNNVMKCLNLEERIKLALTSKKMEVHVKSAKMGIPCYLVRVKDQESNIEIADEKLTLFCGKRLTGYVDGPKMTKQDLIPWLDKSNMIIPSLVNVYRQIQNLFPCPNLFLYVYSDYLKKTNLKDTLLIPEFENWRFLTVEGGKIETEDLNFIMEMASLTRSVEINTRVIPMDFKHDKAFEFFNTEYYDGRWVKIEYLFTLRRIRKVTLGRTNLNSHDLHTLIRYWMDSEHEMFRCLSFKTALDVQLEKNVILDGILTLESLRSGYSTFVFHANNTKDRRRTVGIVDFYDNNFLMYANYTFGVWKRESQILTALHKKKELENELRAISEDEQKIEDLLFGSTERREENRLELQGLLVRKEEVNNEIQKVEENLVREGVFFENGKAVTNF